MGVRVGEKTSLQDAVVSRTHTRHEITRRKGSLFSLGEVVVDIAINNDFTDFDERVVLLGDYFGRVQHVPFVLGHVSLGDGLDVEFPFCCFA